MLNVALEAGWSPVKFDLLLAFSGFLSDFPQLNGGYLSNYHRERLKLQRDEGQWLFSKGSSLIVFSANSELTLLIALNIYNWSSKSCHCLQQWSNHHFHLLSHSLLYGIGFYSCAQENTHSDWEWWKHLSSCSQSKQLQSGMKCGSYWLGLLLSFHKNQLEWCQQSLL